MIKITNGEKIKEIFPNLHIDERSHTVWVGYEAMSFRRDWWDVEYKEPTTKNDLALIYTEGLDEEIRCTMCTNHMKSDRGCDGSCVVNKDMYKAVMDAIEKRIQPTTKNDLGVDREQLKTMIRGLTKWYVKRDNTEVGEPNTAVGLLYDDVMFGIDRLPSVTPQPRKGHWMLRNSFLVPYKCSECNYKSERYDNYCPNCGAKMVELQKSEE